MGGWVADKSWLLIIVLQIDSENSATGGMPIAKYLEIVKTAPLVEQYASNYVTQCICAKNKLTF